jgi:7-alpha-hydroxysteroid dehydrogenase
VFAPDAFSDFTDQNMSLLDNFRLDGKVAVITGGSRGIGAAVAVAFAEMGADVAVAGRSAESLTGLVERVQSFGSRATAVACDLNDLSNVEMLVDAAMADLGGIDVVVNNVGGAMPAAFLDTTLATFEDALRFNVATAYRLTQLATPRMLDRGGGSVINITSAMGRLVDRGYVAYGTAKGALAHMTRLLAADLAPRIRVNAIAPGSIATDALNLVLSSELEQAMISATPMGRIGQAQDVALGAVYLASDASSFLTGKILEIDGGLNFPNLSLGLPDL